MIKMHCDRCGKEIQGTTYYTISFHANDINPANDYTSSFATVCYNLNANAIGAFNSEKQYCKKCIDEIDSFINNKSVTCWFWLFVLTPYRKFKRKVCVIEMYKWKIEIILKSGKEVTVYYRGNESNSTEVANKVLAGRENEMNGFGNEDGTKNILIKLGEIASAAISVAWPVFRWQ